MTTSVGCEKAEAPVSLRSFFSRLSLTTHHHATTSLQVDGAMTVLLVKGQISRQAALKPPPKDYDPENKAEAATQQAYQVRLIIV